MDENHMEIDIILEEAVKSVLDLVGQGVETVKGKINDVVEVGKVHIRNLVSMLQIIMYLLLPVPEEGFSFQVRLPVS